MMRRTGHVVLALAVLLAPLPGCTLIGGAVGAAVDHHAERS